jgi:hypothetical protein
MKLLKLLGGQSQYFCDGADGGSGGSEGGGQAGAGEGGGSAGADGGSNDGDGGDGDGGTGTTPTFAEEMAGKTKEEVIEIALGIRDDRSKKNKIIEGHTDLKARNEELVGAGKELLSRVEALEREKMTDAEKVVADAKKKTETEAESNKLLTDLAAENRDLRLASAANSTGSKVSQEAFVKFALSEYLKTNPTATNEDLATHALEIKAQNPAAFGDGETTLDTGGGGGGANVQGRATILSELEEVEALWKKRFELPLGQRAELTGRRAGLRLKAAAGK